MHRRTKPGDWYESLTKAYVIDGVAADFYALIASGLEPAVARAGARGQDVAGNTEWLRERLQLAIADHPERASRLALWGRRLLGEALTQAREIGEKYDYWGALQAAGPDGRGQEMTAALCPAGGEPFAAHAPTGHDRLSLHLAARTDAPRNRRHLDGPKH